MISLHLIAYVMALVHTICKTSTLHNVTKQKGKSRLVLIQVLVYFCQMGTKLGLISSSCQIIHLGAIQLSVYLHKIAICVDILLRGLPFSYLETHIPSMERANERGPCGNACVRNEFPDE